MITIISSEYGKNVKKRLVDLEMTQTELAKKVSKELGLKVDVYYIGNILSGKRNPKNIKLAINKIIGLEENQAISV